jgi:hypothetical protein
MANGGSGIWTFTTGTVLAGVHGFIVKDITANMASAAFYITVK